MKTFMAALLSLSALAGAAVAADAPPFPYPGLSLGGRAVYYRADDGDRATWNPGAQARWTFVSPIALEVSADYQRHAFEGTTAHALAAQGSVLAYFVRRRVSPFVLAGAGWYLTRVNAPNMRRNLSRIAPHLGLGAQWFVTPEWSLDATYRYVWIDDIDSVDASSRAARAFRRSGSMVTTALNIHFGGKK